MSELDEREVRVSAELAHRVQALSNEAQAAVIDAFREGKHAGALGCADDVLHSVIEWISELERDYADIGPEGIAAFLKLYEGTGRHPVIEAHYGSLTLVLHGVRDEIRRVRPPITAPKRERVRG